MLVYWNEDGASKSFEPKIYYLLKGIIESYDLIINGKKTL